MCNKSNYASFASIYKHYQLFPKLNGFVAGSCLIYVSIRNVDQVIVDAERHYLPTYV